MGKLPGGDRAFIDLAKIGQYLLDPTHRVGRHKARVFAATLGLEQSDAGLLITALKQAAIDAEATSAGADVFGDRFVIAFTMVHEGRSAVIRSSWMIRHGEDFPRLITALVAKQETDNG